MAAKAKNLHMSMDADVRLAAAAGGVARFLADLAGLDNEASAGLQSAVIEACTEAFKRLAAEHPHLEVDFARFPDRLEVSLSYEEVAPVFGTRRVTSLAAKKAATAGSSETLSGMDRVQHETRGKEVVTRLTKYLRQVAPSV